MALLSEECLFLQSVSWIVFAFVLNTVFECNNSCLMLEQRYSGKRFEVHKVLMNQHLLVTRSLKWRHTPHCFMVKLWNKVALRFKWCHVWFHVSYLVHGLHLVWCLLQGWDVGTLCNALSGCVTHDPRVNPSEACAIPPLTLFVCLRARVLCM